MQTPLWPTFYWTDAQTERDFLTQR